MKHTLHLCLFLASLLSFDASAQWAWTDKEGRQVFSDRAPPVDVPEKSIFKRPGQSAPARSMDVSAPVGLPETVPDTAVSIQSGASNPKPKGVDQDLAERMKKAAQAQDEQRKAEQERISRLRADNCQRARSAQQTLNSGFRLVKSNEQGEREIMDKAARAEEAKRIQSIIDSDCSQ